MSGKGSARRRENTALVEANWPFPDRKAEAPRREGVGWVMDSEPVRLNLIAGQSSRTADQALADSMRAENLAAANRNTEQPAKDGSDAW